MIFYLGLRARPSFFEPKDSRAACVPIPSLTEYPQHVLHSLGIAAGGGGSLAGLVPTRIHFPGSATFSCHLSAGETFGSQSFRVRSAERVRAPRHVPAREPAQSRVYTSGRMEDLIAFLGLQYLVAMEPRCFKQGCLFQLLCHE